MRATLPAELAVVVALGAAEDVAADFAGKGVETVAMEASAGGARGCAALRALASRWPGRDAILLDADSVLPPAWWPRLQSAGGSQATPAVVLSPLTSGDLAPESDARPDAAAIAALDARLHAVSDHATLPTNTWSPGLSYWPADALARIDTTARDGELPVGVSGHRLDHLCIGAADSLAQDLPAVAALHSRLAALGEQTLPLHGLDDRPVVLHVLHGWGGGAARFVEDLAQADGEHHHLVLLARGSSSRRCHGERLALHADLHAAPIRMWPLSAPIAASASASAEYREILAQVQRDFGVGAVLVSSLIGHSLDALRTGLPTAVVCHDYYPLWPRLHADFDDATRDFSATAMPAALRDVRGFEFADERPAAWQALRRDYLAALTDANALLIAPSGTVRTNLLRIEPALAQHPWRHIEHGFAPFPHTDAVIASDAQRKTLRIVVVGRINGAKGEHLLARLLPRLPEGVELVLLGGGAAAMRFFGQRGVHVLLNYHRDDLPELLARLRPDAALLASTVAETYSYTLSELWSLGVPVIATRLGSFAERIEHGRTGLLVAPEAEALAQLLSSLRDDRAPLDALRTQPRVALPTLATMAQAYRAALTPASPAPVAPAAANLAAASHLHEAGAARLAAALRDAETRLVARQRELEQRADWALTQERIARDRTRWAKELEQQAQELTALSKDLQREVDARGAWAQTLLSETERLKALIVFEQQRLEDEVRAVDATLQREQQAHADTRTEMQAQLDRIYRSSSWRLTKPLRWLRRHLAALPTRVTFQTKRALATRHRFARSLKQRGLRGTLRRIGEEFKPPQPMPALVLPAELPIDAPLPAIPQADAPRASIVVPVYNHFHHTRTCLAALAAMTDASSFEVIVVDDCSSDESAKRLPLVEGLLYVRNPENLGFIGACNAGAAIARGEFIVFLNNDTAVQPGWLDALLDTFDQHENVGLVGAKLVYPDGRLQEAGGIVFSDGSGWNYGRFDDPADARYNYVREVDYCSGAAIALRTELLREFGGFDAHYTPAYYEDTDLAMKVRAAGLRVLYQPKSVVVHFEGVTSGTDTAGSGTKRYQVINQAKFLERWREVLASHAPPGTDIAIAREHRARKRVLIIDATTPQPDHDSGSLRLVNLMKVLRADGCAVTFFADNRAWVEGYTEALQQLGVEVLWYPWLSEPVRWFADNGKRFDLVFISRHYIASSYVGLVRLHAPRATLVFDTVDLHYLREQREAELSGREDLAKTAAETRAKELALIRSCDATLVVSPVEQELLSREAPGARVEVLSNVHEVFGRRREFAQRRDLMFVGGFQHPPNIDAATWFVRQIFPLVRTELPDVVFHIIGSRATAEVRALGEVDGVTFHGFVADLEPMLDGIRLAVAPLRYGAGVKGKVNMSMSYGQPVVATPIAVEGMYAEPGRDVLVASAPAEFAAAIVAAYRDNAMWTALSDHGLENVRRHFSFEAARDAVRRLLD